MKKGAPDNGVEKERFKGRKKKAPEPRFWKRGERSGTPTRGEKEEGRLITKKKKARPLEKGNEPPEKKDLLRKGKKKKGCPTQFQQKKEGGGGEGSVLVSSEGGKKHTGKPTGGKKEERQSLGGKRGGHALEEKKGKKRKKSIEGKGNSDSSDRKGDQDFRRPIKERRRGTTLFQDRKKGGFSSLADQVNTNLNPASRKRQGRGHVRLLQRGRGKQTSLPICPRKEKRRE